MFIELKVFHWKTPRGKVSTKTVGINVDDIRFFSPGVNVTMADSSKQEIYEIRNDEDVSYVVMSEGSGWTVDMPYSELRKLIIPQVEQAPAKPAPVIDYSHYRYRMCGDYGWEYCDGVCKSCSKHKAFTFTTDHTTTADKNSAIAYYTTAKD